MTLSICKLQIDIYVHAILVKFKCIGFITANSDIYIVDYEQKQQILSCLDKFSQDQVHDTISHGWERKLI